MYKINYFSCFTLLTIYKKLKTRKMGSAYNYIIGYVRSSKNNEKKENIINEDNNEKKEKIYFFPINYSIIQEISFFYDNYKNQKVSF